jgi:MFS family permease
MALDVEAGHRTAPRPKGGAAGVRAREAVWAATLGLVLADSSIVTLALPDMLRTFDATVFGVSWVLTAFNVVLAACVLPAARLAQRRASWAWAVGLTFFAAASLACAVAPSVGLLIAARCGQALGGAAIVAGAIELLAGSRGSHRSAAALWGTAGIAGLAVGPAAGGLLTELFSWEAIFLLQIPALVALPAAWASSPRLTERGPAGALDAGPEVALGLLSAGLTGALFLLVLLLIEGWRNSPLEAAAVVSVMPVATVGARSLTRVLGDARPVAAAGGVAIAGGLAALGVLPGAGAGWTLGPQLLVGAGIALALPALTERALSGPDPGGRRAAGTIAARHAGIVLGILLLTPIFTAQLEEQHDAALRSGTALLLDAPLPPETKIALATEIGRRIEAADGQLPELGAAFGAVRPPPGAKDVYERLERDLEEEIDKAATRAFSTSFLAAGALALLSLVPIGIARWR